MLSLTTALILIGAYLLGGLPWGLLLGWWLRGVDIRRYGSGKTGATNAARTLGWRISLAVFVLDLLKGIIAVLVARWLTGDPVVESLAGIAAIVGHCWSPYIRFGGGRGIATGIGGALAIAPGAVLLVAPVGLLIVGVTRYVSLASILGALTVAIGIIIGVVLGLTDPAYLLYAFVGAPLVIAKHHDNIRRLLSGTERKLGEPAPVASHASNSSHAG
jgi:glycerol-3-phosphate acyltransferase PlsY